MRQADLLLFPSRNENLPLTLLEAQAVDCRSSPRM